MAAGVLRPRIITDNTGQYVSSEFKAYLREGNISHTRTLGPPGVGTTHLAIGLTVKVDEIKS